VDKRSFHTRVTLYATEIINLFLKFTAFASTGCEEATDVGENERAKLY
jgi:hypothetical protein